MVCIWLYLVITANFEKTSYRANEYNGSIAPKLILSRPSSCSLIVHAQFVEFGELTDIHTYYVYM